MRQTTIRHRARAVLAPAAILAVLAAGPASAYIGPGAGIGAIGAAIALILGVLFVLVGFLWFPLKRLMRKRQSNAGQTSGVKTDSVS
jgi:hypothetical protein